MGPTDPKISSVLGKGTTKGNGRKSASLISILGLLEEQCVGPKWRDYSLEPTGNHNLSYEMQGVKHDKHGFV